MSGALDFLFATAEDAAARLGLLEAIKLAVAAADPDGVSLKNQVPAAIVYPLGEEADENRAGRGATVQVVRARLGVLHIVAARNAPGGKGRLASAGAVVAATRENLLGWSPPGANAPLSLAGASLEDVGDGRLLWLDRYAVDWTLDSQGFNGA